MPPVPSTALTAAKRQIVTFAALGSGPTCVFSARGNSDHRAFAAVWQPIRAQRFSTAPHGGRALTLLLFLGVPLPRRPDRCVTTARTATARPTGRLRSVTSLASGEAQTVAPSGEQVSRDSMSPGVGAE